MTDAKISDLTNSNHKAERCYKVTILNYADKTELKFDMAKTEGTEKIEDAIRLAVQNGCEWKEAAWLKSKKKDDPK